ncbi:MAG: DUF5606 domain-containing protein, partial [Bacteroidaceae bacterium]|nr:DUF5606 domain-containing protein [Bacteroidaceae bacterium]
MLNMILAISGKPGLFRLVSQGKNMIIVESLKDKRRMPAYGNEKIISLGDIAMYTDEEDVPLRQVLKSIQTKENGALVSLDPKKASNDELKDFLQEVLPNFDRDRVHPSDIRKLIQWYNLLTECGETDFEEP